MLLGTLEDAALLQMPDEDGGGRAAQLHHLDRATQVPSAS